METTIAVKQREAFVLLGPTASILVLTFFFHLHEA